MYLWMHKGWNTFTQNSGKAWFAIWMYRNEESVFLLLDLCCISTLFANNMLLKILCKIELSRGTVDLGPYSMHITTDKGNTFLTPSKKNLPCFCTIIFQPESTTEPWKLNLDFVHPYSLAILPHTQQEAFLPTSFLPHGPSNKSGSCTAIFHTSKPVSSLEFW